MAGREKEIAIGLWLLGVGLWPLAFGLWHNQLDDCLTIQRLSHFYERADYYPFGLTMAGISSKAAGKLENRFKYNGIELDSSLGLNAYEAHFRDLDPAIGRWWQIDPKIEEGQESLSPYAAMGNDPVKMSDPLGDVPCCKELWADIKSAVKETANAAYNGAVSVARTFNTYVNPLASVYEVATGKSTESDFTADKPRSVSGMEAAIAIVPGLKLESAFAKAGEKLVASAVEKYEVGTADNLLSRSVKGDGLDVHHVS